MHFRVELPDGRYTLVPEGGSEGVGGELHYVGIEQDLDQSPEEPAANFASEGKHRFIINPILVLFKVSQLSLLMYAHLRSGVAMKP